MLPRLHHSMQPNLLAIRQTRLHRPRRSQRHHESKSLVRRKRLQMPPPNRIQIFPRPRRLLVLRIGHNPHRSKLSHRQILHHSRLRAHQHNFPLHILPRVITLLRPLTHVHQLRRHIRTLAVLRQRNRLYCKARNLFLYLISLLYLRQFSFLRVPRRTRPLRSIKNLPVRRKLQNRHIAQSIRPQLLRHQLRRLMKSFRPPLPMKPRNPFQVPLRRLPANLPRNCRHILLPQQRRLLRADSARQRQPHNNCAHNFHCHNFISILLTIPFQPRRNQGQKLVILRASDEDARRTSTSTPPKLQPSPPLRLLLSAIGSLVGSLSLLHYFFASLPLLLFISTFIPFIGFPLFNFAASTINFFSAGLFTSPTVRTFTCRTLFPVPSSNPSGSGSAAPRKKINVTCSFPVIK